MYLRYKHFFTFFLQEDNVGLVEDFITKIKREEGFRFDGQVAEFIGIDRRVLANYKHNDNLPYRLQEWFCDKYNVKLKDFHNEVKEVNSKKGADDDMDYKYLSKIQKGLIINIKRLIVLLPLCKKIEKLKTNLLFILKPRLIGI